MPTTDAIGATTPTATTATPVAAPAVDPEASGKSLIERMNKGAQVEDKTVGKDKLGKDDFLQLLVTSLKYQDPSSPMDTNQLMQQTTVLAQMEQMTEMTKYSRESFNVQQRTQAAGLVGANITWRDVDEQGNAIERTGVATSVSFQGTGVPKLRVGTVDVDLDQIIGVKAWDAASAANTPKPGATNDAAPADNTDAAGATAAAASAGATTQPHNAGTENNNENGMDAVGRINDNNGV